MFARFSPFSRFLLVNFFVLSAIWAVIGATSAETFARVAGVLIGTFSFGIQMLINEEKGEGDSRIASICMAVIASIFAGLFTFLTPLLGNVGACLLSTLWLTTAVLALQYAWLPKAYKPKALEQDTAAAPTA